MWPSGWGDWVSRVHLTLTRRKYFMKVIPGDEEHNQTLPYFCPSPTPEGSPTLRRARGAGRALIARGHPDEDIYFAKGWLGPFSFFGGVPRSMLYGNTKLAVARILGHGKRKLTRVFREVLSHYLLCARVLSPPRGEIE